MSHRRLFMLTALLVIAAVLGACAGTKLPQGCPPNCSGLFLRYGKLSKIDLSGADLSGTDLARAELSEANLSNANLTDADLSWADLTKANLRGANLTRADMRWTKLWGADLTGVDLTGVTPSFAPYDAFTKWPEGFDPKAAGAILVPKE